MREKHSGCHGIKIGQGKGRKAHQEGMQLSGEGPYLQDARDAKGWILEGLDPYHCQEGLDKGTERSEIELAL